MNQFLYFIIIRPIQLTEEAQGESLDKRNKVIERRSQRRVDVTSMIAREKGFPDQWIVATYFNARHNVRRLDERRFDSNGPELGSAPVCHCDAIIRRR